MIYTLHFAVLAVACPLAAVPLVRAGWAVRAPRTAIVCWQALALTWTLSVIGTVIGTGLAPYRLGIGGPGELLIGDDPGGGFGGQVCTVAVPAALRGLAGVAGVRVDGGDDPVGGDLAGDPSAPVGAVGALGGFHVLPSDQGQQRQRRLGPLVQRRVGGLDRGNQRDGVVDQRRHQRVLGGRIVPVDRGLPGRV
jgi:hypothetical protein